MGHITDVNFVKPFIEGTLKTLKIQCHVEAKPGKPHMKGKSKDFVLQADIAGLIGITSDSFKGSISLCFPEKTFIGVMNKMLGENYTSITNEVEDGAGELTNIIFGHAKQVLNTQGHTIQKALPSIVRGAGLKVNHLTEIPTVVLPFDTDVGPFFIEVAIEPSS